MAILRKKIVAGNWKMNRTAADARKLVNEVFLGVKKFDAVDIVLCPPFTALSAVSEMLADVPNVFLGAQNVHQAASGAYTGEISVEMLRELHCRYVIIGHSERRQYFHESDELVCQKVKAALAGNLRPIVCVGETLEERESGSWRDVLFRQITVGLQGIPESDLADMVIAYEPVWAIGTGRTATPEQAQETHAYVRGVVAQHISAEVARKLRIQYGGSVKPENAAEILHQPDIDGALVGGASLDGRAFSSIVLSAGVEAPAAA
ncbi:MAG: triose-phosphate isomerase [Verrucomicrobium sp.]|nr:triose-phosphate isomerase [Verrucomicrobium sp.]